MPDPESRLRQVFDRHLDVGLHHGAQLSVRVDGDRAVDLAGGVTGPDGEPTTADRRHLLFSCTKPLAGVACLQLVEAGALGLDDRIVEHWPGYAEPGSAKAEATVRHALSHQAGIPEAPFARDPEVYADWDRAVEGMEDAALQFEPGTDGVYHGLTYGWLVGELIRRASDTPVDRYVREHVLDPLGMDDTHVGLPDGIDDDVATLVGFGAFDRCRDPTEDEPYTRDEIAALYNTETVHRAVQPAANGVGTARDLARFYACLANGGALDGTRIVGADVLAKATTPQADLSTADDPAEPYGLGFELGSPTRTFGAVSPPRVFGHAGLGSSTAWADPEAGLAVAYVTNGIRDGFEHHARAGLVAHAVRELFG